MLPQWYYSVYKTAQRPPSLVTTELDWLASEANVLHEFMLLYIKLVPIQRY
jgi:hypothetical protein